MNDEMEDQPPMRIDTTDAMPPADSARIAHEATERLNNQNRLLIGARMLPSETALTEDQTQTVVELYEGYAKQNGITLTQLSRETGYSKAVLSTWTNRSYKGRVDAVTRAINDFVERDSRRRLNQRPKDYVPTTIAETTRTYCNIADKRCLMCAIVVPAGAGKTKVLKVLTETMRGLYVYCAEGMTAKDLYLAIAIGLGWKNGSGSRGLLLRFIVQKLEGTRRIIFVDEAHHAGKHIGCLRSIYDQAQVPIVMAGTEKIIELVNDRSHGKGQFSSRCIRYNALDALAASGPGSDQSADLFTVQEIKAFFDMKRIRLDRDALMLLWALACLPMHGTLRLVESTVDTAFDLNPELDVVTRDDVIDALHLLIGNEASILQTTAQRRIDSGGNTMRTARAG